MTSIGTVWDRTTEVLGGRAGVLAPVAAVSLFVPAVLRDAVVVYAARPGSAGFAIGAALVSILVLVAAVWGSLAIVAIAIDPATTAAQARAAAGRRLLPALGVTALLLVAAVLLVLPPIFVLAASGVDLAGFGQTATMPRMPAGVGGFLAIYAIVAAVLFLLAVARLLLVSPVIVAERRGIGAIRRSFALTRGLTWKLVGVLLLYAIVAGIAGAAAQFVLGTIFRLVLGANQQATVTLLAGIAGAAVSAVLSVIASVFTAQLYVERTGREAARAFE